MNDYLCHRIIHHFTKKIIMAEQQEVKSKRDLLGERLKTKYPEKDYADDEALFGQIYDDYDEYENTLKQKGEAESRLTNMFSQYPHSARFIADMASGVNPWVGMVEQLGMDGITDIFDNPEYKEELAKAQEKYVERMAKSKELEDEYNVNMGGTLEMLREVQSEMNLGDEQIDQAVDLLMGIGNDAIVGKISRESFLMALKAINHDADMENARTEGALDGRNAKIVEQLHKPKPTDGVPMLAGSNNAPVTKSNKNSIFDLAAQA